MPDPIKTRDAIEQLQTEFNRPALREELILQQADGYLMQPGGPTGVTGVAYAGLTGPTGVLGPTGAMPLGPVGPTGPRGPTGP